MTVGTRPGDVMAATTTEPATSARGSLLSWIVGLLVLVVLLQVVALVMMNSRMSDLQQRVDSGTAAAESASMTQPSSDQNALDACRILGGMSVKAGVDLSTVFRDQAVSGDCETAAEAAARALRSAG